MARGAKPLTLIDTDEFGTLLTQWNVVSGPDRGRPQVDGRRPVQLILQLKVITQLVRNGITSVITRRLERCGCSGIYMNDLLKKMVHTLIGPKIH